MLTTFGYNFHPFYSHIKMFGFICPHDIKLMERRDNFLISILIVHFKVMLKTNYNCDFFFLWGQVQVSVDENEYL